GSGFANLISIPEAISKGIPMPEIGTATERTSRRELLQQFGALHEQQVQLRELAAELIPPTPTQEETEAQVEPAPASTPSPAQLEPLAASQLAMSERLKELAEQLDASGLMESVRDSAALKTAISDSLDKTQLALDDLQAGRVTSIRASQAGAQYSLESVLGALKSHDWAAKIGLLTIVVLVLWNTVTPGRLKVIPAPLVAVVVATVVTALLQLPVLYVEVPDNLWSEVHFPSLTVLGSVSIGVIVQAGVVLAAVASAETLLCATAVDQMQTESRTQYDRELAAQGVGNMICGFLGALPMTGVIVRSAANVGAGARTRLSTILHGTWLLVFVSLLAFLLRMIPTAALAAMLVYTGYKLVNIKAIAKLKKYGTGEVMIYFITLGTIVCTDLLTGVLTGIGISALRLLHTFSHLEVRLSVDEQSKLASLNMEGAATFIRLPVLAAELEKVPHDVELHVDFEHLNYIDHACLDLLVNWAKQHEGTGGTLVIDWESLHTNFHRSPYQSPGKQSDNGGQRNQAAVSTAD
ncbi:MAG: SulP family inorganic anion transporter, partial [Pirellulales bacterium]|nr:SulP family inorganic anion transporter [Pirellulales bacterium]